MPAERSSKKTNDTQGPYRRLPRLSSPDVPDFLLPAMLSPAEEHQQEVRRAELNKEVANLGEIAAADPASDVKKQRYDDAVEDYVDQWGLFVPDEDHAKWLLKKTAHQANLFKHHHRVLDSAFGVDDPMIGDYCLLLELFEKDYRERFTIDEDEPHMSNVCGRYRAAEGLTKFCDGDTDKIYKITQKKMRYSFNNLYSDATRAAAFVVKYRNLYRHILDVNASLSDARVALHMDIFDACHAATGALHFVVPGLNDRNESLRLRKLYIRNDPHHQGSPFFENFTVFASLPFRSEDPPPLKGDPTCSRRSPRSTFAFHYKWSNQLSAIGNASLGDGEGVESYASGCLGGVWLKRGRDADLSCIQYHAMYEVRLRPLRDTRLVRGHFVASKCMRECELWKECVQEAKIVLNDVAQALWTTAGRPAELLDVRLWAMLARARARPLRATMSKIDGGRSLRRRRRNRGGQGGWRARGGDPEVWPATGAVGGERASRWVVVAVVVASAEAGSGGEANVQGGDAPQEVVVVVVNGGAGGGAEVDVRGGGERRDGRRRRGGRSGRCASGHVVVSGEAGGGAEANVPGTAGLVEGNAPQDMLKIVIIFTTLRCKQDENKYQAEI
ncbi:hypothetical protein C8J57DRAFT_1235043 [Mycena rebaudengoi]|nr:hypothetical protein C8J57DRAFT_1235043 [Mycena rebaudengoi]